MIRLRRMIGVAALVVIIWTIAGCAPALIPAAPQTTTPAAQPVSTTSGPVPLQDALKTLEPRDVWQNFYSLTQIPRPSGKSEQVRAFLVKFGQDAGLKTTVDDVGNVLVYKPAAPGMEKRQGVILQAHMDMVAQAASGKTFDFSKDPIQAYVDNGWVRADGTTLGADDGIGMAIALAVLQSRALAIGPLEVLFTVDEESTMAGANGLKPGLLQGTALINLDSEEEGKFIIGGAGGASATITTTYAQVPLPAGMAAYRLQVQGLMGGHSGADINLGRGHAGKLLVRFLRDAAPQYGLRLADIASGTVANAIPRDGSALVAIPEGKKDAFLQGVGAYEATVKDELKAVEPNLSVQAVEADSPAQVMEETAQRTLIDALLATPQGVMRMSDSMPGLVETSTNMGILSGKDGVLNVTCYMRSSVDSARNGLAGMLASVWDLAGIQVAVSEGYPAWPPNTNSPLLGLMQQVYQEKYGQPPEVTAVHAGLECGTIVNKYPGMDAISIGPTMKDVHSPGEKLEVASVQKLMDFLLATLQRLPEK